MQVQAPWRGMAAARGCAVPAAGRGGGVSPPVAICPRQSRKPFLRLRRHTSAEAVGPHVRRAKPALLAPENP